MEKESLYVWVHPDFVQVDVPEIKAWERAIIGLKQISSSALVFVPWDFPKKRDVNNLTDLCELAQLTLGDRFFSWTKGRFITQKSINLLPITHRHKKSARCYGLQPGFCVQDQVDYLISSKSFNQVINEGYYPGNAFQ